MHHTTPPIFFSIQRQNPRAIPQFKLIKKNAGSLFLEKKMILDSSKTQGVRQEIPQLQNITYRIFLKN